MSYWVEVHCDVRSEVPDPEGEHNANICWGHTNDYPSSSGVTPTLAARWAEQTAKKRGWKRKRIQEDDWSFLGWVCPHCQKFPPLETA